MGVQRQGVSAELDELSSELLGQALDLLAEGEDLNVLLAVEDEARNVASYEFEDDGVEQLLSAAYQRVRELGRRGGDRGDDLGRAVRYALVYEGAVEVSGAFRDALLLEFGEHGWKAWSAYLLIEGKGEGDGFAWTDPAPAGEVPCLL